ncbi:hypothetical protein TCAL_16167, partial [Tigriopus californicus]
PPSAPHFGDIHEALAKSLERALYKAMTQAQQRESMREFELRILLSQVAGFLKSPKMAIVNVLAEEQNVRRHLRYHKLRTVLWEVTGFLKSRPFMYKSTNPGDGRALIPNHFLPLRSNA